MMPVPGAPSSRAPDRRVRFWRAGLAGLTSTLRRAISEAKELLVKLRPFQLTFACTIRTKGSRSRISTPSPRHSN